MKPYYTLELVGVKSKATFPIVDSDVALLCESALLKGSIEMGMFIDSRVSVSLLL